MSQLIDESLIDVHFPKESYRPNQKEVIQGAVGAINQGVKYIIAECPTGSGKSHLAREIHTNSLRKESVFQVVDLASLYTGLLEDELFGHERGAYTGASLRRKGYLQQADGGTVFLDEIAEEREARTEGAA